MNQSRLRQSGPVCCAVLIAAVSTVAVGCTRRDPNVPKVDAALVLFNDRFNAGQFHKIYQAADSRFQQSVNEADFTTKLAGLLKEHGQIQSSGLNGIEGMTRWQKLFPESKPTRFVGYYSQCKSGGFQELFTFDVTGDDAKLLEFYTSVEDANKLRRQ
jgi:hypothetical protein